MQRLLSLALLALCLLTAPLAAADMPHILTPAVRAKWKAQADAGNPWCSYARWSMEADPTWFAQRTVCSCYQAWLTTGEQKYLDLATADELMMPEVSATVKVTHLAEIGHAIDALLLRPHLPPDKQAEWERRLKLLADQMLAGVRIGDWDQCVTYWLYWKILDEHLGTDYTTRPAVLKVQAYVDQTMQPENVAGGPFDESSMYELSTAKLIVWGVAAIGIDKVPWFRPWAEQYADFLWWSVSSDLRVAAAWGDQQGEDTEKMYAFHRIGVMIALAGMGFDDDGRLKSLAKALIGKPSTSNPHSLYPHGGGNVQMLCDPEVLHAAPKVDLTEGTYVAAGIGLAIVRRRDFYAVVSMQPTINRLGEKKPGDDHGYVGGWGHVKVWRCNAEGQGEWLLAQPHGYSIGGNEWDSHNALTLKNNGWLWQRKFSGATITPTGLVARGEMWGPSNRFYHAPDENRRGTDADFTGCRVTCEIEIDGERVTIRDQWTSPGDTFPSWTGELPVVRRAFHARATMQRTASGLTWRGATLTTKLQGASGNPVTDAVSIEERPVQWGLSAGWYRAILATPKDLFIGSRETTIEPAAPLPSGELPPAADVQLIDQDDPGYSAPGWTRYAGQGHGGSVDYVAAGTGEKVARWTAKVTPGRYKVGATWSAASNRATNAPYSVLAGETVLATKAVNQKLAPADGWELLGEVAVTGDRLSVVLTDEADNNVIADAVRVERVGDLPKVPAARKRKTPTVPQSP